MENNNTPATKRDLSELEARMVDRFTELEARMVDRFTEALRDVETKLLTAFHQWAPAMEIRVRSHGQNINTLDERVTLLEERIANMERKH